MNKKYGIQKHVFQMIRLFSLFAVTGAFFFISIPFLLKGDYSVLRAPLLKIGLLVSPLLFLISMALDRLSVLLKKCGITVTDSTIIYEGLISRKTFHFNDVTRFQFIRKFPFSTRGRLATNEDEIYIPFYVEDLPELIKSIRKSLNLLSKSDVYKNGNIADFDLRARYNGLVSEMMFKSVPFLITSFLVVISIDVVVLFHFWEIPLIFGLLWIIQSIFYPSAAYLLSFTIISEKIKSSIKNDPESKMLPEMSTVFIYSGIIFTILYLTSGTILRYFVETHWTRL